MQFLTRRREQLRGNTADVPTLGTCFGTYPRCWR
jgi:hypothetical protein